MSILARVGASIQTLVGEFAEQAARETGVIVRRRKFSALSLARTFVLGHLQKPTASDEDLAQIAVQCGAEVTPQAVEQRHTGKMVKFLETLFRKGVQLAVRSNQTVAPLLERFSSVILLDSSTIALPESMREQFPGCGGGHGGGEAAVKLQTELDLRDGAVQVSLEAGKSTDGATPRQWAERPVGSLRISDLGYFNMAVFAGLVQAGSHFLSRLLYGTAVIWQDAAVADLLSWLESQATRVVDQPVRLGKRDRLPCRLLAWRVPPEVANRRRQKMREVVRRKRNCEPRPECLALCGWTILVTSVPLELFSADEAMALYRARWQVELLFKRWKSQDKVDLLNGSTPERQMVRLWSRLLAALLQHWLVVATAWGDRACSLSKVCEAIRKLADRLMLALAAMPLLERVLNDLCRVVAKTCRRNKRSKAGTIELLNDPSRLNYGTTELQTGLT
jgi:hypothetical protein